MSIRKKKLHLDSEKPLKKTKLESKSSVLGLLVDNYKSDEELNNTEDEAYADFMKEIEQTDSTETNNGKKDKETEELWYQSYDDNTKHNYYYNPKTNESVWVLPEGAKIADPTTEKSSDEIISLSQNKLQVNASPLSGVSDEVEEVLYIDNGSEEIQNKQTSPAKNPELLEDKSPSVSSEDEKPFSDSPIDPSENELKAVESEPIVNTSCAQVKLEKVTRHELRELYETNCEKCQFFETGLHPILYTYIQMQVRFKSFLDHFHTTSTFYLIIVLTLTCQNCYSLYVS